MSVTKSRIKQEESDKEEGEIPDKEEGEIPDTMILPKTEDNRRRPNQDFSSASSNGNHVHHQQYEHNKKKAKTEHRWNSKFVSHHTSVRPRQEGRQETTNHRNHNANATNVKKEAADENDKPPVTSLQPPLDGGSPVRPATTAAATTAVANDSVSTDTRKRPFHASSHPVVYGQPIPVLSQYNFPAIGSILGPYFCLGKLGKGTFSSIHKVIHLGSSNVHLDRPMIAAAKIELGDFQQSGVLDSEAAILDFLYHSLPPGKVPCYMGHYKSTNHDSSAANTAAAALVMEYLPGEDMHQIRETVMNENRHVSNSRRVALEDAVYLTADVLLPLLREMHHVGMVHRDVKPSNCVRRHSREFCLVDFGLSKSLIVPADSELAHPAHPWPEDRPWLRPSSYTGKAAYRHERSKADFRGTSMYASLRVHQERDYCPRDDVWSLLYVFCDLVSGGLPWMSHAASRDREGCQRLKERIHGNSGAETALLLMGDAYHVAAFRKHEQLKSLSITDQAKILPEPLAYCKDPRKVDLLCKAFAHVGQLGFYDAPDYALVQQCIRGFLEETSHSRELAASIPVISRIQWEKRPSSPTLNRRPPNANTIPVWEPQGTMTSTGDDDDDYFAKAEDERKSEFETAAMASGNSTTPLSQSSLPVEMQFRLAQMKHTVELAKKDKSGATSEDPPPSPSKVLDDWMHAVLPLLYGTWDAKEHEEGGHRTSTDGFRRERYLQLLQECSRCAKQCSSFQSPEFYFDSPSSQRRPVKIHWNGSTQSSPMIFVSRTLVGLDRAIQQEKAKKPPPPKRLSFS